MPKTPKIEQPTVWSYVSTPDLEGALIRGQSQVGRWRHTLQQARFTVDKARVERAFWKGYVKDIKAELAKRPKEEQSL